MPGNAQTTEFLLSTATLMIGPQADCMSLTPALHSVGLVKNVQMMAEPQFAELGQGIDDRTVMSVMIKNDVKISAEVYEYTAKNLAYANGLNAVTGYTAMTVNSTLASAVTNGGDELVLDTGDGADWSIGDFGFVYDTAMDSKVHVFKVLSKATDTLTLAADYEMPTGMTFPTATTVVQKVNHLPVGTKASQPTFGAKIVGVMPGDSNPVVMVFPKVKITKGLNLNFSGEFANMPFEFTPYALVASDPFYAEFGFGSDQAKIFKAK